MSTASPVPSSLAGARQRGHRLGVALALTAAVLFATNATVSKSLLLSGVEATRLAQLRSTGAFLCFAVIVLITNRSAFRIRRSEWPALLAFAILGIGVTQFMYFIAISHLPIGVALLLEYTAPILVALYVTARGRERGGRAVWLGLGLALLGLALVAQIWAGFHLNVIGVLAGLTAALCLGVYFIAGEKAVAAPRDVMSLTMWGFGFSTIAWAVIQPWWSFPWQELTSPTTTVGLAAQGVPMLALVAWMILIGGVASFSIELLGLRLLGPAQASTIAMLEPVFAAVIAWIVLSESLTPVQVIGGLLVLTGVYVTQRARTAKRADSAATAVSAPD